MGVVVSGEFCQTEVGNHCLELEIDEYIGSLDISVDNFWMA